MKAKGFTVIELVVVIVLLGIIATITVPRMFDVSSFNNRTFYEEVAAAASYAQKLAVASGCEVQFAVAANSYALQQHETDCTNGDFVTITGHAITSGSEAGISLTSAPASFVFDAMGRSSSNATVTVGTYSFDVVAETGYVDATD